MTADVIAIVQWTVNTFHKLYADQGQSYILQLQRLIIWTALGSNYVWREQQLSSGKANNLPCRARGSGFKPGSRHLDFRDWLSPVSKLNIHD